MKQKKVAPNKKNLMVISNPSAFGGRQHRCRLEAAGGLHCPQMKGIEL